MYINRIEPRLKADTASRKSVVRKEKGESGESFADTMASVLEIDVVQVGDSTEEEQKKQEAPTSRKRRAADEAPEDSSQPKGLDIKV